MHSISAGPCCPPSLLLCYFVVRVRHWLPPFLQTLKVCNSLKHQRAVSLTATLNNKHRRCVICGHLCFNFLWGGYSQNGLVGQFSVQNLFLCCQTEQNRTEFDTSHHSVHHSASFASIKAYKNTLEDTVFTFSHSNLNQKIYLDELQL